MGNKSSTDSIKSRKLSLALSRSKKDDAEKLKLLLLGAGESGKSTIFKQMKVLYGQGYTPEERHKIRPFLISNINEGALDILNAGVAVGVELKNPAALEAAETLHELDDKRVFTDESVSAVQTLWQDEDFRKIYERRSQFQLQDTWGDLADLLMDYPNWGGPDWTPTTDELLMCRVRTTGVVDELFVVKNVKLRMLDVGGQRNERRKWIHCFEDVTSVLFVSSLSEYDQVLFEDSSKNRLADSLELFGEIANGRWFKESALILFLNKTDLFADKYVTKKIPLNASGLFPDAPEGEPDLAVAYEWFQKKFGEGIKDKKRNYFVHFTCATDTTGIDAVMRACSKHILEQNLKGSGVLS